MTVVVSPECVHALILVLGSGPIAAYLQATEACVECHIGTD